MEPPTKDVTIKFVRRYTLEEHVCPVCQTAFQGPRLRVYCSPECSRKAAWTRNGDRYNTARNERRKQRQ